MTLIAKKLVFPEVLDLPDPRVQAEKQLEGGVLHVTVNLPFCEPADVRWSMTKSSLRVATRTEPSELLIAIPLPQGLRRDCFIVHAENGVFDVSIALIP